MDGSEILYSSKEPLANTIDRSHTDKSRFYRNNALADELYLVYYMYKDLKK